MNGACHSNRRSRTRTELRHDGFSDSRLTYESYRWSWSVIDLRPQEISWIKSLPRSPRSKTSSCGSGQLAENCSGTPRQALMYVLSRSVLSKCSPARGQEEVRRVGRFDDPGFVL